MKDSEISELLTEKSQNESQINDMFLERVQATLDHKKALTKMEDTVNDLEKQLEISRNECEFLKKHLVSQTKEILEK